MDFRELSLCINHERFTKLNRGSKLSPIKPFVVASMFDLKNAFYQV